jgi:hypothetical protein
MPTVYVTFFSDKTEAEARARFATGNRFCGHRCRTKVQPDDLILMVNNKAKGQGRIVGVARAATSCLPASLQEELGGYLGDDAKYNKFAILIKDLILLDRPYLQRDLREAIGIDEEESKTNIYKGFPNSWQPAFIKRDDETTILMRLVSWIEGCLATA